MHKTLLNAILAGLALGIAGTVNLMVPNPVVGAALFGFGLFLILCYQFKLYTGAVGYLVSQTRVLWYLWNLAVIWVGNLLGTLGAGLLIRQTRIFPKFQARVTEMCQAKLDDAPLSVFILAFFCGILMYVAVESFRRTEWQPLFRAMMVFLCVAIFILAGFEHCIANMYYFSVAGMWDPAGRTLLAVLVMTLGNSVGGWLLPTCDKFRLA